jgi:hypothetical protein
MENIAARETHLINGMAVIDCPELIKIKTMKKKYLEQLPQGNFKYDETFYGDDDIKFFGYSRPFVIYARGNKLEKIHDADFVGLYAEDFGISREDAWAKIKALPVIYQD